jgi:hypothetical protein
MVLASAAFLASVLLGACSEQRGQTNDGDAFWGGIAPVEVAAGRAHRGPWRMNASDFDYVDDPAVAIAGDGRVAVAWADQTRRDVFFQMYAPAGGPRFLEPVNLSATPDTFSWLPRLVIAADDPQRIYALWQEIVFSGGSHGGEIFFARSSDGGATFSVPINLSNSLAGDGKGRLTVDRWDNGSLDLAAGPNGRLYAAWTEFEGRLLVSRSTDDGATFTAPIPIHGNANRAARAPALAVGRDWIVHLAWSAGGQDAADIRIAASVDGGQSFGTPQVMASRGHADAPKIVTDGQGSVHLVFAESGKAPSRQYRVRYARRDAGGDRFSGPRTIAGGDDGTDSVNFPDLAVDAASRIYVVWDVSPAPGNCPRGLAFTMSRDGGQSFSAPEMVPESDDPKLGTSGGLQGSLMARLAVNADGGLALVHSTFASGRSSHIWLWRKSPPAR